LILKEAKNHLMHTFFIGRKGMLVEVKDQGEGIPEEIRIKLGKRNYDEQFVKGDRGLGYCGINKRLVKGVIDDVEIEGSAVRLLKMYPKTISPSELRHYKKL